METDSLHHAIDLDLLLGRINNDQDFLQELLKDFMQDIQAKLLKLKIYLLDEDFDGIHMIAHTLKSTTAFLTTYFLHEAVCKLENAAKKRDSSMVFTYFKIFENEFSNLIEFLDKDLQMVVH